MLHLRLETPEDLDAIETLLDLAFGPDRRRKVSYRYRNGIPPIRELCLVAEEAGRIVGTIRYWPIRLDDQPALLLGPVATDPNRRAVGIGRALIFESLARAADLNWRLVFLVGDPEYYRRFGFVVVPPHIVMPGEDPRRLQWRGLGGATLPARGGELLRADGTRIQPGEQGSANGAQSLVRGHFLRHLAEAGGESGGDPALPGRLVEPNDPRLDREHDRPCAG